MNTKRKELTIEDVVRILLQKGYVEVNEYRWKVGKRFRDMLYRAERLGLVQDLGGRPDRRVYVATNLGASKVLSPKAEIRWMQRMAELFLLWLKWEAQFSRGRLA